MSDVNWWLMALAFVLGLVLTFLLTVRRVTREVPVYAALGRGSRSVDDSPDEATAAAAKFADTSATSTATTAAVTDEPYGAGSARVAAGGAAPEGWNVKGNEDSMLYHSTESPSYGVTRAEVWFRDVATAEAAGFSRWDSGKSRRGLK